MEETMQDRKGLFTVGVYLVIGMHKYWGSYAVIRLGWKVQAEEIKAKTGKRRGGQSKGDYKGKGGDEREINSDCRGLHFLGSLIEKWRAEGVRLWVKKIIVE